MQNSVSFLQISIKEEIIGINPEYYRYYEKKLSSFLNYLSHFDASHKWIA
jgi:hypothetical protein